MVLLLCIWFISVTNLDERGGCKEDGTCEAPCIDKAAQCELWAEQGECERNPGYMVLNCMRSCDACHLADPETRCKVGPEDEQIPDVGPGDVEVSSVALLSCPHHDHIYTYSFTCIAQKHTLLDTL